MRLVSAWVPTVHWLKVGHHSCVQLSVTLQTLDSDHMTHTQLQIVTFARRNLTALCRAALLDNCVKKSDEIYDLSGQFSEINNQLGETNNVWK